MKLGLVIWIAVTACYGGNAAVGVPCAASGECPPGQICDPRSSPPVCRVALDDASLADGPENFDAIPQMQIDAPMALAHTIPPGAVLWLKLDDDPSDGVLDSAGDHPVTCTAACPTVVAGKFGSAYHFTGAHRLETPDAPELRPGTAFTAGAWVKLDTLPTDTFGTAVCKQFSSTEASLCLSIRMNGKPDFYTVNNDTAVAAGTVDAGTWHHLAMTWDGATKRGFLDGALYATQAISSITVAAQPFVVGTFEPSTYPFAGLIDDVVFYNRVLSDPEIVTLATP